MNLADIFEYVARAVPEREAMVAGARRYNYRQLNVRANRLANYWLQQGIKPGDTIGVLAQNRGEWVEAMLAAFKIRAVPVNINFRYVASELDHLFRDAELKALVLERRYIPQVQQALPLAQYLLLDGDGGQGADTALAGAIDYEQALASTAESQDFQGRSGSDIYMLYTGGTTGVPKGTLWRHEDIFYAALKGGNPMGEPIARLEELDALLPNSAMTIFSPAPLMHGGGQWTALITLLSGGRFVMYCEDSFDAHRVWQTVAQEQCNSLLIVGDAMGRPLAAALAEQNYELSALFVISSGGAILSPAVKALLAEQLPNVFMLDSHGSTETGYNGAMVDVQLGDGESGVRFQLADCAAVLDQQLVPVAPGETGVLARRGHIPLGYHNDPAKTASTFVTDSQGTRWVLTGDYVRRHEDGQAEFLGRGSGCINSGGEKVFAEEVEVVLTAHPDVLDAAVIATPCPRFGQQVTAVVQLRENCELSLQALNDFARQRLARYKLPRALLTIDTLPRTPAAKPDYGRIKAYAERTLSAQEKSIC